MDEVDLKGVHVDRSDELSRFRAMISGVGDAHVLLIRADGGMGKTSLLRAFWETSSSLPRISVDLKGSTHSVERVLGEAAAQHRHRFAPFFDRMERMGSGGGIYINESRISHSQFDIKLSATSQSDAREIRQQSLTDAFFNDLLSSSFGQSPRVMIFDTYDEASDEVKAWLTGLFMSRIRGQRKLVVVVAGRSLPATGIGWDEWCFEQLLQPLGSEHVGEYVSKVRLKLSKEETALLHEITEGQPLTMSLVVGALIKKRSAQHG